MTSLTPQPLDAERPKRTRMTRLERREQLIGIARRLFANRGFDAVSIEEIAAAAAVSKPVVYEHFGGKEGLYQVIVDREMNILTTMIADSMAPSRSPREAVEFTTMSLLSYIDQHTDGFRLLSHQSPEAVAGGTFSTIISDVAEAVTVLLAEHFEKRGLESDKAPLYAHMLAGMIGLMGQWWADNRGTAGASNEARAKAQYDVAAHVVNLLWNGLHGMERTPDLEFVDMYGKAKNRE